jgi:hypothetical protein
MQVQSVGFTDLRDFVPQLRDAFFDRILHDDRLAPHTGRITVKELASTPTTAARQMSGSARVMRKLMMSSREE